MPGLRDLSFITGGGGRVESRGVYEKYWRYRGGSTKILPVERGVYENKIDEIRGGSTKKCFKIFIIFLRLASLGFYFIPQIAYSIKVNLAFSVYIYWYPSYSICPLTNNKWLAPSSTIIYTQHSEARFPNQVTPVAGFCSGLIVIGVWLLHIEQWIAMTLSHVIHYHLRTAMITKL